MTRPPAGSSREGRLHPPGRGGEERQLVSEWAPRRARRRCRRSPLARTPPRRPEVHDVAQKAAHTVAPGIAIRAHCRQPRTASPSPRPDRTQQDGHQAERAPLRQPPGPFRPALRLRGRSPGAITDHPSRIPTAPLGTRRSAPADRAGMRGGRTARRPCRRWTMSPPVTPPSWRAFWNRDVRGIDPTQQFACEGNAMHWVPPRSCSPRPAQREGRRRMVSQYDSKPWLTTRLSHWGS